MIAWRIAEDRASGESGTRLFGVVPDPAGGYHWHVTGWTPTHVTLAQGTAPTFDDARTAAEAWEAANPEPVERPMVWEQGTTLAAPPPSIPAVFNGAIDAALGRGDDDAKDGAT